MRHLHAVILYSVLICSLPCWSSEAFISAGSNFWFWHLVNYILCIGGGSPWTGEDVKGDTRRLAVVPGASLRQVAVHYVGQLPTETAGCLTRTPFLVLQSWSGLRSKERQAWMTEGQHLLQIWKIQEVYNRHARSSKSSSKCYTWRRGECYVGHAHVVAASKERHKFGPNAGRIQKV